MTWYTDIHIGELRPWPDSVDVVRGDETRRYVPEPVRHEGETNWERLFGTPEKASKTIAALGERTGCGIVNCASCPIYDCVACPMFEYGDDERQFRDWLESEVD